MKIRLLFTSLFLIFFITLNSAQAQWTWLNPKPSGHTGKSITFTDAQTGFIVNGKELLRTNDAGETWQVQQSLKGGNEIRFNGNTGAIVGDQGSVYISGDKGASWEEVALQTSENLNAVSVPHPDTIFITGNKNLFRSYNKGISWETRAIQEPGVYNLVITKSIFLNAGVGHAFSSTGTILKTTTGGNSWYVTEKVNVTPSNFLAVFFLNNKVGFASRAHHNLFKTTDGGETWQEQPNLPDAIYAIHFFNEQSGFIAGDHGVIHKTSDGGRTWDWAGFQKGRIDDTSLYGIHFTDEQVGYAVGRRGRIIKTTNGGTTWQDYGLTYNNINHLQFPSDNTGYALGSEVYKSTDKGETWKTVTTGLKEEEYYYSAGYFLSADTGFVSGRKGFYDNGILLKTTDGGKTWVTLGSTFQNINTIFFLNSKIGYLGSSGTSTGSGFLKTEDGGTTWKRVAGFNNRVSKLHFTNPDNGLALNGGDLYQTSDGGLTWRKTYEVYGDLTDISFVNDQIGYLSAEYGLVLKTTDGGATWQELKTDYDHLMAVAFYNENVGYVTGKYGRNLSTTDGGLTWEDFSLPAVVTKLSITSDKTIFGGGGNGILLRSSLAFDEFTLKPLPATELTPVGAVLTGIAASNGAEISDIKLEYGTAGTFNTIAGTTPGAVPAGKAEQVKLEIEGLQPNTTYNYRLRATYKGKEYTSAVLAFMTLPDYSIDYIQANEIGTHSANLSASVRSNLEDITNILFEYGQGNSFSQTLDASPTTIPGGKWANLTASLTQLQPGITYSARLKFTIKGETQVSAVRTFTTKPEYGISVFDPVFTNSDVLLRASVVSNKGNMAGIVFEYGQTRNFGSELTVTPGEAPEGRNTWVQATLTGADATKVYYYRLKAIWDGKAVYSRVGMFRISGGMLLEAGNAEQVTGTGALLTGLIAPQGNYISNIRFEYGETEAYGSTVSATTNYVPPYATSAVEAVVKDLSPGTKYHFRFTCMLNSVAYYSQDQSFTTSSQTSLVDSTDQELVLFPNPTTGLLTVSYQAVMQRLEVFNYAGKQVLVVTPTAQQHKLDLSNQKPGIYLIRIHDSRHTRTMKVLKL